MNTEIKQIPGNVITWKRKKLDNATYQQLKGIIIRDGGMKNLEARRHLGYPDYDSMEKLFDKCVHFVYKTEHVEKAAKGHPNHAIVLAPVGFSDRDINAVLYDILQDMCTDGAGGKRR